MLPGGASRQTVLLEPHPIYVEAGHGAWLTDVDGNRYLDVNGNYTSIILGHGHPAITAAVQAQLGRGTAFALGSEAEVRLAELLCHRVDSVERVRFATSGTEAVMSALKAARAFTGRSTVAKVEGAYHGGYDHAEVSLAPDPTEWGDAPAPASVVYARGTPASVADETIVLPFNDPAAARAIIERHGAHLAAVLLDTLPNRVGMPSPDPRFLQAVTEACQRVGALLIADEVITFRLGPGGHQAKVGLRPDLTVLGKIIGGGFGVGAVGGRAEVMAVFEATDGERAPVPAGGTFAANPVTMAAGLACLEQLTSQAFERLDDLGDRARAGIRDVVSGRGLRWQVTGEGSLFRIHPHDREIRGYREARHRGGEAAAMVQLQRRLLDHGVHLSSYGMGCTSLAMTDDDVDHLVTAVGRSVQAP